MQQSKNNAESWNTQLNANHPDNYPLITNEKIEGTPFHITGGEEHGYLITLGIYRMSPTFKHQDEALHYLTHEHWNLTFQLIVTMVNVQKQIDKEENNTEKK